MTTNLHAASYHRLPGLFVIVICFVCCGCGESRKTGKATATYRGHQVTLAWEPAAPRVAGYHVYRESPPGSAATKLNSEPIAGPEYQDRAVAPGAAYAYYVTTVGAKGRESAPSNRVTVTVPGQ